MTTALEPVGTRVSAEEREIFRKTCESVGTTPSGAIRIFVTCFNNYGGFPFAVRNTPAPKAEPVANEEEAMEFISGYAGKAFNEAW